MADVAVRVDYPDFLAREAILIEKSGYTPYNWLMGANTKYKDSVFSFLFSDPDILRELYCALESVALPPDVPVTINTLKDVLFLNRVNDISFEIGQKLVILIEHQSTINLIAKAALPLNLR